MASRQLDKCSTSNNVLKSTSLIDTIKFQIPPALRRGYARNLRFLVFIQDPCLFTRGELNYKKFTVCLSDIYAIAKETGSLNLLS